MSREIEWLGETAVVGASKEQLIQGNFAAYKNAKLISQWYKSWTYSGGYVGGFNHDATFQSLVKDQWFVAQVAGADRICAWFDLQQTKAAPGPFSDSSNPYIHEKYNICYDGKSFSQNVATNTPVTVTCPTGYMWSASQNKCVLLPHGYGTPPRGLKEATSPLRQPSPYTQTFQPIYGSPEHNPNMRWLPEE